MTGIEGIKPIGSEPIDFNKKKIENPEQKAPSMGGFGPFTNFLTAVRETFSGNTSVDAGCA